MTRMPRRWAASSSVDEVVDGAELRQHLVEVADVVAAVAQRRVVERRQPKAVDAKPLQVVELFGEPAQIAGAVGVGVVERPHQHLVEHGALEPGAVRGQGARHARSRRRSGVPPRRLRRGCPPWGRGRPTRRRGFAYPVGASIRTSNLPTRGEIESGARVAAPLSKESASGGVEERLNPSPNRDTVCATIVPIAGWRLVFNEFFDESSGRVRA